jgi:hypothetical protein
MNKKIIFLDHDGVICLSNNWGGRFKKPGYADKTSPMDVRMDNFDAKAVKVLNDILEKTGADIVISSDWKLHGTLEEIQEMYKTRGIKPPIAVTPRLKDFDENAASLFYWKGWLERMRCLEIQKWLELNPTEKWVAIDDLDMSNEYLKPGLEHFVLTPRSTEGIKQSGIAEKVIKILNETN